MSSMEEVAATIESANTTGLLICSTMTFDTASRSFTGVSPFNFANFAVAQGADFIGSNCNIGLAELLHSVQNILPQVNELPAVAEGNCGIPADVDGAIHYSGTPELMADYAFFARFAGVKVIGGCCGTSPGHVAAMVNSLKSRVKRPFDAAATTTALGTAWDSVDTSGGSSAPRGSRKGRRCWSGIEMGMLS